MHLHPETLRKMADVCLDFWAARYAATRHDISSCELKLRVTVLKEGTLDQTVTTVCTVTSVNTLLETGVVIETITQVCL